MISDFFSLEYAKSFEFAEFCAGVCSLRRIVDFFNSICINWKLTCSTSLLMTPGLFNNDVFICLSVVEDGGMISSASAMAPAAVVGDDVIISLTIVAFLMTADADGWLPLPVRMTALLSVADDDVADFCIISK